ncbi:hypothetical protein [Bacillus sp. FJAT-22090]|uniref:hypothetical protein n=1 Tax=Bacillus sp. FJAT-22090 TaxID=1581038 RepID=UPI0016427A64|nr:hypothetical protein [Bacillus sp. FJAT-22090]
MTKKLIIKELWLLDKNGNRKIKLTPLSEGEIPSLVIKEDIRGGYGNIKENR